MKNWFHRNFKTIVVTAFLIPIIIVAGVSISHVTEWYGVSNPLSWAMYLSVGVEIAALSSLAAISINMGRKVYLPFGVVTFIQFIGNIFFSYSYIDINSPTFKMWVELVSPLTELINTESVDLISHKRILSLLSGGLLPLISLSFLHMLVSFSENEKLEKSNLIMEEKNDDDIIENNVKPLELSDDELKRIYEFISNKELNKVEVKNIEEIKEEIKPIESEPLVTEEIKPTEIKNDEKVIDEVVKKVLDKKERKRKKIVKNSLSEIDNNDIIPSFSKIEPPIESITNEEEKTDEKSESETEIDETWDVGVEPIEVEKKKRRKRKI